MWQFNLAQIDRLSEMTANFSLVMLASLVLPAIAQQQELSQLVIWMGGVLSLSSAIFSLMILKGGSK